MGKTLHQQEQTATRIQAGQRRGMLSRVVRAREMGVFGALVLLFIIMSFASPYFLGMENIFNVLRGMSTVGIMAIGMTMIIVTGGIDLSVGSLLAVSGMLTETPMAGSGFVFSVWL